MTRVSIINEYVMLSSRIFLSINFRLIFYSNSSRSLGNVNLVRILTRSLLSNAYSHRLTNDFQTIMKIQFSVEKN
jgi:hypothetical protein